MNTKNKSHSSPTSQPPTIRIDAEHRRNSIDSRASSDDIDLLTPATSTSGRSESPSHTDHTSKATAMAGKKSARSSPSRASWSPFMVSAPGKVIVYGEHAVVHGKAAIAAAISLRSYLHVSFLHRTQRTVTLRFPDISFDWTWNIDDLPWQAFNAPDKKKNYYDLVTSLDEDLQKALEPHVNEVSPDAPEHMRKWHLSSASCFLYLFLSLDSQRSAAPCVYTLRSTIPIGAGLGSSGSISTCLACALLLQRRALSGPHADQPFDESETQIERINRWAFVGEMCIHGNPSGVDNTVSSGGKAVYFKRTDYSKPPKVERLNSFPELPLLLVNTGQSRSTAAEVAKVGALQEKHPKISEHILSAIDDVTESAHTLIKRKDFDQHDPANLEKFGELFTINHGLLVSLGVSHPKLERIRELVDHAGIGWTKLTGAGGGGCAITIVKPLDDEDGKDKENKKQTNGTDHKAKDMSKDKDMSSQVKSIAGMRKRLAAEGFETFETTLGGDGVGVLWPAVVHSADGEEQGEEIDQESFLETEDNEELEALVGVKAGLVHGEGWKFWRTSA